MNQLNSFLATLRTAYLQQGTLGRILLPGSALLVFCCLCSLLIPFVSARNRANVTPTLVVLPSMDATQATPTPLFDFDFATFTPFPTLTASVPTAFPTWTPLPSGTSTSTPGLPTATLTLPPTNTNTPVPPTATSTAPIAIIRVNKAEEYAEIQNLTGTPINLRGWRLVSEAGNQICELRGTLEPNEILRIWSRRGEPGFDCRFGRDVWRDNEPDPAVLYNPQGEEVSRFP